MESSRSARLGYIDWMRGLACLLMFQTHCYDSWLSATARKSRFFMWSQLGGTLPAPLFLFLAGVSLALVVDKLRQRGNSAQQIANTTFRRGAQILGLGLLFRLQEYAIAFPWAPWTDLLRVDILNIIGLSMMLMSAVCWLVLGVRSNASRLRLTSAGALVAASISLLTPLMWTVWRPAWLPWPIESYINGVHNLGQPQAWLFPIFPWSAFAFAGLAAGFVLLGKSATTSRAYAFVAAGAIGGGTILLGRWLDSLPVHVYPVYDFWHTSPNFFLIRIGILLTIVFVSYAWCRWGWGQLGFSPLIQLGQTSLLVYWVHIEFVYGRFSILRKRGMTVGGASVGLLIIFLSMLALSLMRTRLKGRPIQITSWFHWRARAKPQAAF
ncbi:MAG TPA: heparan-alpha-glucosaminide N-acetyltransferase domain-containing protein [Terriglobales bacterium]|nr:heparan-alpha-glucosaminide N-acetyltransferase domain-containing protein [Terriglobales bacterium]